MNDEQKWYRAVDVPIELVQNHINSVRGIEKDASCNTDKTILHACDVKVKTRGILLVLNSCGVIAGYRELYGSESLTQVANLYLDICDVFKS